MVINIRSKIGLLFFFIFSLKGHYYRSWERKRIYTDRTIFFIVDKGGWISINYGRDPVIVDDKQAVRADQLNKTIKHGEIKSMIPLNLSNTRIAVSTK